MQDTKTAVKIYSAPWCVYCRMAKEYLTSKRVAFEEVDVEQDRSAAQTIFEMTGQAGVPVLQIGEETILGFDRARIDSALNHYKLI